MSHLMFVKSFYSSGQGSEASVEIKRHYLPCTSVTKRQSFIFLTGDWNRTPSICSTTGFNVFMTETIPEGQCTWGNLRHALIFMWDFLVCTFWLRRCRRGLKRTMMFQFCCLDITKRKILNPVLFFEYLELLKWNHSGVSDPKEKLQITNENSIY